MILSLPVKTTLHDFTPGPATPAPVLFKVDNGFYPKGALVTVESRMYRTSTETRTFSLQHGGGYIESNSPSLLHEIEYVNGLRVNYLREDQWYLDFYGLFFPVLKLDYKVPFVRFNYPMISDLTQKVFKNSAGTFDMPGGVHDYIEFVHNGGNITVKMYTGGTSPGNPGALTSSSTQPFPIFAENYPGYVFVLNDWTLSSTIAGIYHSNNDSVKEDIFTLIYESSPTLSIDPRIVKVLDYPPSSVLDGKDYTYNASWQEAEYIVRTDEVFDCVAIAGLTAYRVTVTFYESDGYAIGAQVGNPQVVFVNLQSDLRGLVYADYTTIVVYSPSDNALTTPIPGGYAKIVVEASEEARVGGIYLGASADLGLTDFSFSTKFLDFSPIEENFHVIQYKAGLKVRELTGTFSFWTIYYDLHDRLLLGLGEGRVILDGSDTTYNEYTDSKSYFSALRMVGRMKSIKLKTDKEDDRLGTRATASFTIREQV